MNFKNIETGEFKNEWLNDDENMLDFTDANGVHFIVSLPGRVTVLSGDNATGKTLLRKLEERLEIRGGQILETVIKGFVDFDNSEQ